MTYMTEPRQALVKCSVAYEKKYRESRADADTLNRYFDAFCAEEEALVKMASEKVAKELHWGEGSADRYSRQEITPIRSLTNAAIILNRKPQS